MSLRSARERPTSKSRLVARRGSAEQRAKIARLVDGRWFRACDPLDAELTPLPRAA